MKICHVTSVHPRHDIRICEKECVSLVKRGYETYLVVNDENANEEYKGIQIVSTGRKYAGRIERIFHAPKQVLKLALMVDADVYHLHDPELLTISDKLIKAGKKVIYDAHEDTEKQIGNKYWIPQYMRAIVGHCYGLFSYKKMGRLNGIISVTPSIVEKLRKYNSNVALVTNYPIVSDVCDNSSSMRTQEPDDTKYVFFAGGIMEQWSHERIVKALDTLGDISYYFAGRGRQDYIDKLTANASKARYLGVISHEAVMDYYYKSIAGMAILRSDTQVGEDGTLGNTKLFEIMKAGRPVICSSLRLWREIIEKYNCGICVESDDISSITQAIRFLYENPETGNKMGTNGRNAVENVYNWGTQEKELFDFYDKIIGNL